MSANVQLGVPKDRKDVGLGLHPHQLVDCFNNQ
jgi:hypothetical protein